VIKALKTDRNIDMVEEINIALLAKIIEAINELTSDEFVDLVRGYRGSLSFLQSNSGSFKLSDDRCICGGIENIPCQWLRQGERCNGEFCQHFINRATTQEATHD